MANARPELPSPALVLVTDSARLAGREPAVELDGVVREAVPGGVNVVQLREKHLGTADLVAMGLRVQEAIAGRALFFVNGDLEGARALRADGIHLPAAGPTVAEARAALGDGVLISVAAHSVDDAMRATRDGADVIQIGTAFATSSKPGVATLGVEGVRDVCEAVTAPVIAIGGVTAANAGKLIRAGARGVAVVGAIMDAADPRAAARSIREALFAARRVAR